MLFSLNGSNIRLEQYIKEKYISKDKIREKLKYLDEEYNNMRQTSDFIIADVLQPQIRILKDLLEDK